MENDINNLDNVDVKLTIEFCKYLMDYIIYSTNVQSRNEIFIEFLKHTYLDL